MKNRKKEEKQKSAAFKCGCRQRVWKVVAIAVVVVFAVIIVGGIIKARYIRSSFIRPTEAQIDYATKIAAENLQSRGINASEFQVQAGRMMRRVHDNSVARSIIQVSFYNDTTTHTCLVDVNLGEVLLHSETNVHKALGGQHKPYRDENPLYPQMPSPGFLKDEGGKGRR